MRRCIGGDSKRQGMRCTIEKYQKMVDKAVACII